jgi:quercetin dioxygenase-like cupin family protein
MNYPFEQEKINNIILRTFSSEVDEMELIWHKDQEDRIVTVLEGNGWQLQMDNQLPIKMIAGESYYIPKMVYHRIIKGKNTLLIQIKENKPWQR